MSGAYRLKRPRKRDASVADRNALCRARVKAGLVRLVIYAEPAWLNARRKPRWRWMWLGNKWQHSTARTGTPEGDHYAEKLREAPW